MLLEVTDWAKRMLCFLFSPMQLARLQSDMVKYLRKRSRTSRNDHSFLTPTSTSLLIPTIYLRYHKLTPCALHPVTILNNLTISFICCRNNIFSFDPSYILYAFLSNYIYILIKNAFIFGLNLDRLQEFVMKYKKYKFLILSICIYICIYIHIFIVYTHYNIARNEWN